MKTFKNKEAEQGVIGSILIDNNQVKMVDLAPEDFYEIANAAIFRGILALSKAGRPIDTITLGSYLEAHETMKEAGGTSLLVDFLGKDFYPRNCSEYAATVKEMSVRRQLYKASLEIGEFAGGKDISGGLAKAKESLGCVIKESKGGNVITPKQSADSLMKMVEEAGTGDPSIPWGFLDLDRATGGLFPGDYILIGARPSVGKTQLMIQSAIDIAKRDHTVLFASAEMLERGVLERVLSMELGIPLRDIRQRLLKDEEWGKVTEVAALVSELPLYFIYGKRTSDNIYSAAARMKDSIGLDVVFVDYLQKLRDCTDKRFGENQNIRVTYVSATMDSISKDLEIPVVVATQLSRASELRHDKRPELSDLRDSGSLEQDADVTVLLHRELDETNQTKVNELLCRAAKVRQGGDTPPFKLLWSKTLNKYVDKAVTSYD